MKGEARKLLRDAAHIFVKEIARGGGKEVIYNIRKKIRKKMQEQRDKEREEKEQQ